MTEEIIKEEQNLAGKVESILREAQKNKSFKDSDIRVGGSKKEMAAIRKLLRFGLQELNENETHYGEVAMIKFVKKDQVFPKFNVKEQLDSGVTAGAAFLKMKLRESFPNEPQVKTKYSRRVYVGFANLLYDTFLPVANVAGFIKKRDEIDQNIKRLVSKFLFGEKEEYETVVRNLMSFFDAKDARTIFMDFDDAYDYIYVFCKNELEDQRLILDNLKKDLEKFLFYTGDYRTNAYLAITNGKINISLSEEELKSYLDNLRFVDENTDHEKLFDLIIKFKEAVTKCSIITLNTDYTSYSFYREDMTSPFWGMSLRLLPELRDKHKRPLRLDVDNSEFLKSFFSSTFRNFIEARYDTAATESYSLAKKYEAVSEDQSLISIENCAKGFRESLQKIQEQHRLAVGARSISDFDKLYNEDKFDGYGFFMDFYKKTGRKVRDHAYWRNLTDSGDKQNWIIKYIQNCEKRIKEITAKIEGCELSNKPHPDDWSWASEYLSDKQKVSIGVEVSEQKRKAHSKPMLDYIERIGGLKIDKTKIGEIEHIKKYMTEFFGFRAYEFGKSLKDEDAGEIIFHFLGAIADLGDILNIDLAGINRKMGLSMGFASRGSGSASAHYECLGRIINLTKSNGDGSVAHEMAHYFDNIIPAFDDISDYSFMKWATAMKNDKSGRVADLRNFYVRDAITQIMSFILYGKKKVTINGSDIYDSGNGAMVEYVAKGDSVEGWRWNHVVPPYENIDDLPKLMSKLYGYGRYAYFENLSRNDLKVFDIILRDKGIAEHTFKIPSKMSIYYRDSKNVGGDYWVRPWELFARAFEVYVSDKMKAAGRYNNYLCNGEYQSETQEYIPNYPYPQFEERKYLLKLFDNLFEQLKKQYSIGDFVPFTEEKNGFTKVDIDLTESKESKEQKAYIKRLKVLRLMLSSGRETIVLNNGFTVTYKIGSPYRQIGNTFGKFYLSSIKKNRILLTDDTILKNQFEVTPDDFVKNYQEDIEMGSGGEFKEAIKSIAPADDFYTLFLKVYEDYAKWTESEQQRSRESRMRNDYFSDPDKESTEILENELTKLYSYPDWKKQLKIIDSVAFETNRAQKFEDLKEEILLNLADRIINCYDFETSDASQIFTLQLAIDAVNSMDSKTKIGLRRYESAHIQKILRERGEFTGKKSDEKIKEAAEKAQEIISEIFDTIQIDIDTLEDIMKRGKEFEEHKVFGFNKVMISRYGGEYHAQKVEKINFGHKKNTASIQICQDLNGKYYFGVGYDYHNGGSSYGCWLDKAKAKDTKQECYNDFYITTTLRMKGSDWPENEYRKILKEIKEKLNIPETVVVRAEDLLAEKLEQKRLKKEMEDAAEKAAIAEMKKLIDVGDHVWMNDSRRYVFDKEEKYEYKIVSFEHANFIGDDYGKELHPELPDYIVCVNCIRVNPDATSDKYEDQFPEQDLYIGIVDGTVRQMNWDFSSIDNEHPYSEPIKISHD